MTLFRLVSKICNTKSIKVRINFSSISIKLNDNKVSKGKIAVAMSGGIDSSVAAMLLQEQGYECVGVFMNNWDNTDEKGIEICPRDTDYNDMLEVCNRLNITAYKVDFVKEYWNDVFMPFLDSYKSGIETPNPDVLCNRYVKFHYFRKYIEEKLNITMMATGHYAQLDNNLTNENDLVIEKSDLIDNNNNNVRLRSGFDSSKDQSYFLSKTPGKSFENVLFPIGKYTKEYVKKIASTKFKGLNILTKAESMGICFIGKRLMPVFLSNYIELTPGRFIDIDTNEVIGNHNGLESYTIGQGAKMGGLKDKYFIVDKPRCNKNGDIFVGKGKFHNALYCDSLLVNGNDFSWINGDLPDVFGFNNRKENYNKNIDNILMCTFKARYQQKIQKCKVSILINNSIDCGYDLLVQFEFPQRAITPGQIIALYDQNGDVCLGGGSITFAGDSYFKQNKEFSIDCKNNL